MTWQPARFTGVACQSAGAKWDLIGFNSDVGCHFVTFREGRRHRPRTLLS